MDELKNTIKKTLASNPRGTLMDLMLTDILNRHGVGEKDLGNLSPEKKRKIKDIAATLRNELEQFID